MTNKKKIGEMSEVELYFLIDGIGGFIWQMNHDMADGRIPQKNHQVIDDDIEKMRQTQLEAIRELSRIGITQPLDEQGRGTPEYWTWYRTWSAWHKNKITSEEWNVLNRHMSHGLTAEEIEECKCRAFDLLLPEHCDTLFSHK